MTRRGRVVVVLVLAALAGLALLVRYWIDAAHLAAPENVCSVVGADYALDPDQAGNAATIAAVAARRHLPERAVVIALATALQESKLYNLTAGDRDSVGLFQQRPSQGWGSVAQLHDPVYATGAFYDALVGVPHWQTRPLTQVAQAVQRSGFPDAYAQWEKTARPLAATLFGQRPAGLACRYVQPPTPVRRAQVLAQLSNQLPVHPAGNAVPVPNTRTGWQVAAWLVANGRRLGVSTVTFAGRTWTNDDEHWSAAKNNAPATQVRLTMANPAA